MEWCSGPDCLTIGHVMTMSMHDQHSPPTCAAQMLAAGQTQLPDFSKGACRHLPLHTGNYTTCLALLLSNSAATSSHVNIPPA